MKMSGRPIVNDLTGQTYGRLYVMSRVPRTDRVIWVCKCECGNTCEVQTFDLISGKVRSCSCYHKERQREIMKLRYDCQRNSYFIIKKTSSKHGIQ